MAFRPDLERRADGGFREAAGNAGLPGGAVCGGGPARRWEANAAYVPPYGSGATLYVQSLICLALMPIIGVKPADEYQFRVFTTPVGPYFKGGAKPLTHPRQQTIDRAAPHGTGHVKAGLNYAMSLHAIVERPRGRDSTRICTWTRPPVRKVEETGGANFLFRDQRQEGGDSAYPARFFPPSPDVPCCMWLSSTWAWKWKSGRVYSGRGQRVRRVRSVRNGGGHLPGREDRRIMDKEICFPSGMDEMGPIDPRSCTTH